MLAGRPLARNAIHPQIRTQGPAASSPSPLRSSMATRNQEPLLLLPASAPVEELTIPGRKRGPWLPTPEKEEEEEKLLIPLAPDAAVPNFTKSGKKMRRPLVPMTEEEQEKLMDLKDRHQSGSKELQELMEKRKELRKHRDELLFRRRCLAARFVNRLVLQDLDAGYVRHPLLIGLKLGDRLPEEIKKARMPISRTLFYYVDMGRVMNMGMDAFIADFQSVLENVKNKGTQHRENEVETEAVCDQNGAPLGPVAQK